MQAQRLLAALGLVGLGACVDAMGPTGGGGLSLLIDQASVTGLDSGYVRVRGPTTRTVKVTPGATVAIDSLVPGNYVVAIEGFDSGGVARFFEIADVTVMPGQVTTVAPSAAELWSFVPNMVSLPASGMSTTFTVSYNSVAGAASYEIEAATDQQFTANRVSVVAVATSAQVTVASPGTYYVRVRAVDPYQGRGRASPSQTVQLAPPPPILLSATTVTFGATQTGQGNGTSVEQRVSVTSGSAATLSGLSAAVTYTAGQPTGWLAVRFSSTTAPSTLILTATTGNLAAGTYTATVSVASPVASNSPQTVSATFDVAAPPSAIVLSSSSISFSGTALGADPAPQMVSVTNGGGGGITGLSASVTYAAGQPTGWLAASLSSTMAPSTLTLTATTGALLVGTYTATVSVTSPVVSNSPQTVTVTFSVAPL